LGQRGQPYLVAELAAIVIAIICHEAGHAAAAQAVGLEWRPFARLPWKIGVAVVAPGPGIRPRDDLVIALAGPAASALLAAFTFQVAPWLSLLSAMLAVLNLLPFPGTDGRRAIGAARRLALSEQR
jgi:stage IV sporulation protein FB